jgi:hypothetical protein
MMSRKKDKTVRQKQKQRQSQKVVVNIRSEPKSARRRRAPRRPRVDTAAMDYLQPQQLPIVAYQTGYGTYPTIQGDVFRQPQQPAPVFLNQVAQPPFPRPPEIDLNAIRSEVSATPGPTREEVERMFINPVSKNESGLYSNRPDYVYGGNPEPSSVSAIATIATQPEVAVGTVYNKSGTKSYFIEKIKQLSGKTMDANKATLKELRYMYNVLKKGNQK